MPKKFREVRKALEEAGWVRVRQAGSHESWRHDETGRKVTIAGKNSDTVPAGTLSAIRRATGLDQLR